MSSTVSILSGKFDDDFAQDDSIRGQGTLTYVNEAGVSEGVMEAVRAHQDISNAIETWSRSLSEGTQGPGSTKRPNYDLFQRDRYHTTDNIFRTIELCSSVVENDDILSTLCDVSEGIAIQKMKFEMYDEDQQDVWNQIARDLDLDSRLREIWRELFKVSHVYIAVEWDYRNYTVRTKPNPKEKRRLLGGAKGPGRGNRNRKKEFRIFCPTGLSVLDPKKVVPVGNLMFGRERFAYIADKGESGGIHSAIHGEVIDDMVMRLIERKYEPSAVEKQNLGNMGIPTDRLWLFRQNAVFRHTMTKSQYERFTTPRLKSVLPLIDMKQHLREADRAALVGNTNFIVVIRKGSDKHPAKAKELEALHEQARVIARVPVIIGDHRLSVEIVAPPMDNTLDERRHNTLDARLVFRALGSFAPASAGAGSLGGGSSQVDEVSLVVSRGFENRRHQIGRSLERALFRTTVDNNDELTETPSLLFSPRRITLNVNQDIVNAVLKLRDRGEISRGTALEELDYDQEVEAIRRVREEEEFDDIFLTHVPFDSPTNAPAPGAGGKAGNKPNDTEGGRPAGSRTQKKKGE